MDGSGSEKESERERERNRKKEMESVEQEGGRELSNDIILMKL